MHALGKVRRSTILRRWRAGYTPQGIARELGVSANAVRSVLLAAGVAQVTVDTRTKKQQETAT